MYSKVIIGVLLLVIIVGGGFFLYNSGRESLIASNEVKSTQTTTTSSNTTPAAPVEKQVEWKKFHSPKGKVSFEFPSTWEVNEDQPGEKTPYGRITAKGSEGEIILDYGTGLGGACPQGPKDMQFGNAVAKVCVRDDNNSTDDWGIFGIKDTTGENFNSNNYGGNVSMNPPESSHDLVLKIISTFSFYK